MPNGLDADIVDRIEDNDASLKRVSFNDRNVISDEGATRLAKALESNMHCTHLLLQKNKIGDIGAKSIAQTLELNSTLTHLDLRYNPIGMAGIASLAKSIEKNDQVTSFFVSFTRIRACPNPNEKGPSARLLQNVKYMKVCLLPNSVLKLS